MLPIELITKVKKRLGGNTLPQSPTPAQILERGIDEYQNATVRGNNTGNAWAVNELVINAPAGIRRFEITTPDFSKALLVSTIPDADNRVGERALEFTQIEQLPNDWAWLSATSGWFGLFGGQTNASAAYVAFFRLAGGATGFKNFVEIRPTPSAAEQYRILYQTGDWSKNMTADLNFKFPFPELNFYFVALIANGVLPLCRWSNSEQADLLMARKFKEQFVEDLARYQQTFDDFLASLSVSDVVFGESFGEYMTGY